MVKAEERPKVITKLNNTKLNTTFLSNLLTYDILMNCKYYRKTVVQHFIRLATKYNF